MRPLTVSMENDVNRHHFNGELYTALIKEDEKKVINLCRKAFEHALHILTIHDDTVLHMATYSKQANLVHKLLEELPQCHLVKMTRQNHLGNTILHEAATSNHAVPVADRVLQKAPGLLGMRNHLGETALFRAARYGKSEMVEFFADRISGYNEAGQRAFLRRSDKTNVLHISILHQHFDLALKIARKYEHLIGEPDADGMTALQLLSCSPLPFKRGNEDGFLKRLINSIELCCSSPRQKPVVEEKKGKIYVSALELAKFLIERDTSWEATYPGIDQSKPKLHKYGANSDTLSHEKGHGETPLLLATKSGCVEIVEEILRLYPQAVEHIDDEGRNILHVAIKYRQLNIFKLVRKMEVPMKRLVRKVDNKGNSILHMVGIKRKDYVPEKMQGPALELQEELLWFERVKKITLAHFIHHQNHMKQTADGLFASTHHELRNLAKGWLKRTGEGCSVVSVLIATVAFAAAYTIPGGPNNDTGIPNLLHHNFFVVFTISDVLSLTFALTAVVTFLSILTSPFRMEDFKHSIPNKLIRGFTFLFLSVAMMMIAFAATIILMIQNKGNLVKVTLHAIAFFPVGIFALSYCSLYLSLSRPYKNFLKKARQAFTWNKITKSSSCHATPQTSSTSNV